MQNNPIIDKMEFVYRRTSLQKAISEPILLMGNTVSARNFPANHLPFRQDSTFWYFSGCTIPGAAILLLNTEHILFLPPQDPNDDQARITRIQRRHCEISWGFIDTYP